MILCTHYFTFFFFFNDTATTEIYTLSLHDALPIWPELPDHVAPEFPDRAAPGLPERSEEHTSELQSLAYLVCRLLLEKKKKQVIICRVLDIKVRISHSDPISLRFFVSPL